MDVNFVGEHLLPGRLGQFFVILSFGSALLATFSYYFATVKDIADNSWRNIGRAATWVNSFSVIGIGAALFYIIYNHYFEYHYAWAHSSKALPVHYIISCFWEGQEGSFWLWTFWQAVLANVLIWKAKSWENSVLTIVMLAQTVLASMLLGVEFFGTRIGSSPFILLRTAMEAPIFSRPDYLTLIQDGNGLNPLLQNYWMVIHPPTLFLGFASMIVPFAYAIAGLWQRRYPEWIKPVMPWTLFAVMILGTGIIMGSFWAYEALNFGGFWAWDPVENASIIPWLTLIAAVHVLIAYKNSGHAYFTATFLVLISFVLVLYASFLTRSGILGETSVHAFTDLGMFWHLILFIFIFVALMVYFLVTRWKQLPISKKDEEVYSREFWLFIGALVLVISCVQIISSTSVPVVNAIFKTEIAPPTNAIQHYNKWQVPLAVVIALISGLAQFLKYKNTNTTKFYKSVGISMAIAAVVTAGFTYITKIYTNYMFVLLTFTSAFSVVANAELLFEAFKGKWKLAGSAVAHIGFALLLVGALVAAATNRVISINNTGFGFGDEFSKSNNPKENIILYLNEPVQMNEYAVTYTGDSVSGVNTFYRVNYRVKDEKGKIVEDFNLYPNAQQNAKMRQIIASPDTKHYLTYDIYTHVSSVPLKEESGHTDHEDHEDHEGHDHANEDMYLEPRTNLVSVGDTVKYKTGFIVVKSVNRNASIQNIPLANGDIAVGMKLEINTEGKKFETEPTYVVKGGNVYDFGKTVDEAGSKLRFTRIDPAKDKLELMIYEKKPAERKWIVMKAVMFPYINLLWGGTIIMVIGFLISIFRRNKELKTT